MDLLADPAFLQTLQLDMERNVDKLALLVRYIAPDSDALVDARDASSKRHGRSSSIKRSVRSLSLLLRKHFGTQVASEVLSDLPFHQPDHLSDDMYSQLEQMLCPQRPRHHGDASELPDDDLPPPPMPPVPISVSAAAIASSTDQALPCATSPTVSQHLANGAASATQASAAAAAAADAAAVAAVATVANAASPPTSPTSSSCLSSAASLQSSPAATAHHAAAQQQQQQQQPLSQVLESMATLKHTGHHHSPATASAKAGTNPPDQDAPLAELLKDGQVIRTENDTIIYAAPARPFPDNHLYDVLVIDSAASSSPATAAAAQNDPHVHYGVPLLGQRSLRRGSNPTAYLLENDSGSLSQYSQRVSSFVSIMDTLAHPTSPTDARFHKNSPLPANRSVLSTAVAALTGSRAVPLSLRTRRPSHLALDTTAAHLSAVSESQLEDTSAVLSSSISDIRKSADEMLSDTLMHLGGGGEPTATGDAYAVHDKYAASASANGDAEASPFVDNMPFPCDQCRSILTPPMADAHPSLAALLHSVSGASSSNAHAVADPHSPLSAVSFPQDAKQGPVQAVITSLQLIQMSIFFHEHNDLKSSCHFLLHAVYVSERVEHAANPTALFLLALHLRHGWGCHPDRSASYRLMWTALATVFDLYAREVQQVSVLRQRKRRHSIEAGRRLSVSQLQVTADPEETMPPAGPAATSLEAVAHRQASTSTGVALPTPTPSADLISELMQLDPHMDIEADVESWSPDTRLRHAAIKHHEILKQMPERVAGAIKKYRPAGTPPLKLPSFLQDSWATSTATGNPAAALNTSPPPPLPSADATTAAAAAAAATEPPMAAAASMAPTSLSLSLLRSTLGILVYEISQSIRFGWTAGDVDSSSADLADPHHHHAQSSGEQGHSLRRHFSLRKARRPQQAHNPDQTVIESPPSLTPTSSPAKESADLSSPPSPSPPVFPKPHLAHRLLLVAAHLGDPSACVDLGMYLLRRGSKANKRAAVQYFRAAAVTGGWYEFGMGWVFKEKYDAYCQ
ncbi:hypothetical protein RI367_004107 [Sorochytrium milnesiophthora]